MSVHMEETSEAQGFLEANKLPFAAVLGAGE